MLHLPQQHDHLIQKSHKKKDDLFHIIFNSEANYIAMPHKTFHNP